jgi:hypothetical protein
LKQASELDLEKLQQYCQLFECKVGEVLSWYKQIREKLDPAIPESRELLDIFERIIYLPSNSDSMEILLDELKRLRDFYRDNYVALKGPKFIDNLFQEIDKIFTRTVSDVKSLVSRHYSRLQREKEVM